MTFAEQLEQFETTTKDKIALVTSKIVVDVAQSLIDRSPVGDGALWKKKPPKGYEGGQFKANWNYGFNSANQLTTTNIDKTGDATLSKIEASVVADSGVHFITNSLPYGPRLENGWSAQAPAGMVNLAVIEFQAIVGNAIRTYA